MLRGWRVGIDIIEKGRGGVKNKGIASNATRVAWVGIDWQRGGLEGRGKASHQMQPAPYILNIKSFYSLHVVAYTQQDDFDGRNNREEFEYIASAKLWYKNMCYGTIFGTIFFR
jgi:hypothetical protein